MNGELATLYGTMVLAAVALLAHEPFRWLGLVLGRRLSPQSDVFIWVKAVATALVAALVMRLLLFPAGALENVPLAARMLAFLAGVGIFHLAGGKVAAGVVGAAAALILAHALTGAG